MSTYSGVKVKDPALEQHFTQGELRTYRAQFDSIQSGVEELSLEQLKSNFSKLGFEQPLDDKEVEDLVENFDVGKSGFFNFEAFLRLQLDLDTPTSKFKSKASPRKPPSQRAFLRASTSFALHTLNASESHAFTQHVNRFLANDRHLAKSLPLDPNNTDQLLELVKRGVLLCKLINIAVPGTIDERAVNFKENPNPWERIENHTLALNSARAIGCSVVNIGTEDLAEAKPHLVLGLIAQIVKVQLLGMVSMKATPELVQLMDEREDLEDEFKVLLSLSSEALLLRWMNYHLQRGGCKKVVNNFSSDIKDGEAYTYLLHQLDHTRCDLSPLQVSGLQRATRVLEHAEKLRAWHYIQPQDIVEGTANLNLAFVANLFQTRSGLVVDEGKQEYVARLGGEVLQSPELTAFRMWIASLGVAVPGGSLIEGLRDGSALLEILAKLQPNSSRPSAKRAEGRASKSPLKAPFVALERCAEAVEAGKALNLSMVGIAGDDIVAGNKKLILGFLWQLMRYHMFALLQSLGEGGELSDEAILQWANQRTQKAGKPSKMDSFKDKSLSSGIFFLDLLSAVEPRAVNYALITRGETEEEKEQNAAYIISVARKVGCTIFCCKEDIVEVRQKMMVMLVASIMHFELSKTLTPPNSKPAKLPNPVTPSKPYTLGRANSSATKLNPSGTLGGTLGSTPGGTQGSSPGTPTKVGSTLRGTPSTPGSYVGTPSKYFGTPSNNFMGTPGSTSGTPSRSVGTLEGNLGGTSVTPTSNVSAPGGRGGVDSSAISFRKMLKQFETPETPKTTEPTFTPSPKGAVAGRLALFGGEEEMKTTIKNEEETKKTAQVEVATKKAAKSEEETKEIPADAKGTKEVSVDEGKTKWVLLGEEETNKSLIEEQTKPIVTAVSEIRNSKRSTPAGTGKIPSLETLSKKVGDGMVQVSESSSKTPPSSSSTPPPSSKITRLGSNNFVDPVQGLQHFGVKLKRAPPRS